MGEKSTFFERNLDRSAYGACWGLAALMIIIFFVGAWALWTAGTAVAKSNWTSHLPAFHKIDPNPAPLVNSAKNAVHGAAATAAAQAGQAAENQAKDQVSGAM